MSEVVLNAINEFKTEVFSKPFGSAVRKEARRNFIEKLDMAVDYKVITVAESREISSTICGMEREELHEHFKEDMRKIDEVLNDTPEGKLIAQEAYDKFFKNMK